MKYKIEAFKTVWSEGIMGTIYLLCVGLLAMDGLFIYRLVTEVEMFGIPVFNDQFELVGFEVNWQSVVFLVVIDVVAIMATVFQTARFAKDVKHVERLYKNLDSNEGRE